jgi:hypothetical protein
MTWMCAHILIGYFPIDAETWPVRVFENVILLEAPDGDAALVEAERIGRKTATAENPMTIDDAPGEARFLGVRQIITISNVHTAEQDQDPPDRGSEVTYLDLEIASAADLEKLVNGEEVTVTLLDTRRD